MNTAKIEANQSTGKLSGFIQGHEEAYPVELAARYPHILERLALLWPKPAEARAYFQELMVTQRENRQGFPIDVYMEIFALSELYNQLNPLPQNTDDDFWSGVKL